MHDAHPPFVGARRLGCSSFPAETEGEFNIGTESFICVVTGRGSGAPVTVVGIVPVRFRRFHLVPVLFFGQEERHADGYNEKGDD